MKGWMTTAGLAVCLVLAGCGESVHTVGWYKQHSEEAGKKAAWCKQDAARQVSGDCQNAIEAVASAAAFGNGKWKSIDITPKGPNQKK